MEAQELSTLQKLFNNSTYGDSIAQTNKEAKQKQLAEQQIALQDKQKQQSQIALQVEEILTKVKHILNSKLDALQGVDRWEECNSQITYLKVASVAQGYQVAAIQLANKTLQQVTQNTYWESSTFHMHETEHYGEGCNCGSYNLVLTLVHRQPK